MFNISKPCSTRKSDTLVGAAVRLTFTPSGFFNKLLAAEKFLVASIVVRMAPFSFRRALNFFRQSTVSCLCIMEATVERWQIHGCFRASDAVMRLAGLMVSILLMRSLASGVTVSHSGDGNFERRKRYTHSNREQPRTLIISSSSKCLREFTCCVS